VSRGATESDFVMGCPRCHNLMVEETFVDRETSPSVSSFTGWRCLICGEILDPIILEHRRAQREPMIGRARVCSRRASVSTQVQGTRGRRGRGDDPNRAALLFIATERTDLDLQTSSGSEDVNSDGSIQTRSEVSISEEEIMLWRY